ncbi:phosphatase PAP2 family protein [Acholeplasma equirhinis]|uniref:phosphatase PAP2 family protein n=1 Tax=Acholeplasma equirhinis TaxID=555393 RepID=UPI00197A96A2|nr:phosphatase PAP2 family protein [Acholeplasma equirhinis]MBN3490616.1 phosphatase PAP2 family protein [Acholeplasma equirhinis]
MTIELDIIRFIQGMRSGFVDAVMQAITQLGDQFAFIAVALVIYWFVNKKSAFKLVFVFIFSSIVNEGLKALIQRPRPFKEDPALGVGEETHGYSFPSGHAQNTAVISTVLYQEYGKANKWLKWVLLAAMILVPFTRVYLGQHYPSDVIIGLVLGISVAFLIGRVVELMKDREHIYGLLVLIPLVLGVLAIQIFTAPHYDDVKTMFVAAGGLTGFMLGYVLDKFKIMYDEKPQGIKILWRALVGLAGVLILYVGLSAIFDLIAEDNVYLDFIRYAAIGFFGSAGSMFIFKKLKV